MSVYACLGSDASAIRDAFLTRLQSRIEDMRIKVMILDFLTVAVETQPGLIELFLNLEVKDGSDGCKVNAQYRNGPCWIQGGFNCWLHFSFRGPLQDLDLFPLPLPFQEFSLGEWSCLHVVLELMDSERQERYWCPPLLQRATIAFLHALWQDRRDSAMLVLRNKCVNRALSLLLLLQLPALLVDQNIKLRSAKKNENNEKIAEENVEQGGKKHFIFFFVFLGQSFGET